MFAENGQLPDVLFKAALTTEELIRYTESGQLIDLLPLLEENAPNLWALLTENPDWLKAITLPSGKVGALPTIQELSPQNAMWINQSWLDTLNLEKPTDMESLRKVLTAFRDRDPNQNNKKDEIPMLFLGLLYILLIGGCFLATSLHSVIMFNSSSIRLLMSSSVIPFFFSSFLRVAPSDFLSLLLRPSVVIGLLDIQQKKSLIAFAHALSCTPRSTACEIR